MLECLEVNRWREKAGPLIFAGKKYSISTENDYRIQNGLINSEICNDYFSVAEQTGPASIYNKVRSVVSKMLSLSNAVLPIVLF